jgi:hypothetical protein
MSFLGFVVAAVRLPPLAHLSDIFVRHFPTDFQKANLNAGIP